MKFIWSFLFLFAYNSAHSQLVSGELLDSNRKMTFQGDFTIISNYEGTVVYEIAVNIDGKVTSERLIAEKSTVKSTPANMLAKNYLKDLTFEPGVYYPVHHHGMVKVTFVKSVTPPTKTVN